MRIVHINSFGAEHDLELQDLPDPRSPTDTEVLIRVRAAGLNRADVLQVRGLYPPPSGYSPALPGMEFAGEIAATGESVAGWNVGDRVMGIVAGEAQAEFLLADTSILAPIPDNLSFAEAAAIPEVFITADDAIIRQGGLRSGETLLIHAVGSGVGLAGLQIGKAFGAVVIGTSRTAEKLDHCKAFDLDHGIVMGESPEFAVTVSEVTAGRGANVILDLVGGGYFEENLAALAVKGRLVLVGLTSGRSAEFNLGLALQKRAHIIGTVLRGRSTEEKADATRRFESDVLPHLATGRIRPNVDRVFAAEDVREAYLYLESNKSFGKVVLEF